MAKVKVSQATIDGIKKMGMTKALAGVKSSSGAEYKEAVRRMYGERRLEKALGGGYAAKPSTSGSKSGGAVKNPSDPTNFTYKSKNQAPPKTATYTGQTASKAKAKSSGGFRLTPKEVVGGVAALGVLAATKGRGTAVAARLAPGLSKTGAGKAILGKTANAKSSANVMAKKLAALKKEKVTQAQFDAMGAAKSGIAAAKRGGAVTEAQYKAMQAAAKAQGIKATSAEAAKKAATKAPKAKPPVKKAPPAKTPPKKSTVKKAATIGVGAGGAKGGKK